MMKFTKSSEILRDQPLCLMDQVNKKDKINKTKQL